MWGTDVIGTGDTLVGRAWQRLVGDVQYVERIPFAGEPGAQSLGYGRAGPHPPASTLLRVLFSLVATTLRPFSNQAEDPVGGSTVSICGGVVGL